MQRVLLQRRLRLNWSWLLLLACLALARPTLAQPAVEPAQPAQVAPPVDFEAAREAVTPIAGPWRFHPGDDPRWSQPAFDDGSWKTLDPTRAWQAQGYSEQNNMAWFRFSVKLPAGGKPYLLTLPAVPRSVQFFADGILLGQVGRLPPDAPRQVTQVTRIFTLPAASTRDARTVTIALRLWQDPKFVGINANSMSPPLVGAPGPMLRRFQLRKASVLVAAGATYTQNIILLIVGLASLLLAWLTRQSFYAWFAANLIAGILPQPLLFAAEHFALDKSVLLGLYTAIDLLSFVTFVFFVAGAMGLRGAKWILPPVAFGVFADLGPVIVLFFHAPLLWGDLIYFVASTADVLILFWYLIRGWRHRVVDARLLAVPYLLQSFWSIAINLSHPLIDLGFPSGDKLLALNLEVLSNPFTVTVQDLSNILVDLAFLVILVSRFARTSREQQRLSSALAAAHDIQSRLVPMHIPILGGLHTEIAYLAAEEVGGDFCQVLPRADGSVLIAIGDVSGKGLQAAMIGALAVGALRSMADEDIDPANALVRLNQVLLRTENQGFITCLCIHLAHNGAITLANAGHLSPYLDGREINLDPGLPLGMLAEVEYQQTTFQLPPLARLTLLSDGVVEARSPHGDLFGFERTSDISRMTASEIASQAFRHGQQDDITVITLDWYAPAAIASTANVLTPA